MRRQLAAIAGAAALALGCGHGPGRVLVVGIDGATLRVVAPLLAAGRLPNLAALAREGVHGPLRSMPPLESPRIWNTIATGKVPEKHGITGFTHTDAQGRTRLFLGSDRVAHALWNIASERGLRVGVVNWWNTFPPDVVDGVIVSDHFFAEQLASRQRTFGAGAVPSGALTHPPDWELPAPAPDDPLGAIPDPFAGAASLPHWVRRAGLSRVFHTDVEVARAALALEAQVHPDLLLVLLPGVDKVQHSLWGVLEPPELYPPALRPSPAERKAGREALLGYYTFTDALLGFLVARFDPGDLVVVVSDHGAEAGVTLGRLTGVHHSARAAEGILFARGRGIAAGGAMGVVGVADVTPTILAWLGLPVAADMDGAPAPFLETGTVATIPTYEKAPIPREPAGDAGRSEQILENLRALGYLE